MITYTISDKDEFTEKDQVKRAMLADEAFECLYDIQVELRRIYKYTEMSDETEDVIDNLRTFFYELLDGKQISLDKYYR